MVEMPGCDIGRYIALRKLGHNKGGAKDIIKEGAPLHVCLLHYFPCDIEERAVSRGKSEYCLAVDTLYDRENKFYSINRPHSTSGGYLPIPGAYLEDIKTRSPIEAEVRKIQAKKKYDKYLFPVFNPLYMEGNVHPLAGDIPEVGCEPFDDTRVEVSMGTVLYL